MGCAQSVGDCANATTDQVTSVITALGQIALEVVTAGGATGIVEAADAAKASEVAAKEASEKALQEWKQAVKSTTKTQKEIDEALAAAKKAEKAADEASAKATKLATTEEAARTSAENDVKKLNFTKLLKNQGSLTSKDAKGIAVKLVKPDSRQAWAKIGVNAVEAIPKMTGGTYDTANDPNLTDDLKAFKIAQTVLDYASAVDPTGVMAIVDAYTKPMCSLVGQVKPSNSNNTAGSAAASNVGKAKKTYRMLQGDNNSTAGPLSRCMAANPQGCEVVETIAYANCEPGYRDVGLYCNPPGSAPPAAIASTFNNTTVAAAASAAKALAVRWTPMVGNALAIGANARGVLWAIGNAPGDNHPIYRFNGTSWQLMPGAGTRIAVAPDGNAWVVTSGQAIFRFNGTAWQQLPGGASDIAVGANGSVWIIGGGGAIYRLNVPATSPGPYQWQQIPGGGTRIAVGPDGNAWLVNAAHQIFRYNGSSWTLLPGAATAIAVDSGGLAYVVGMDGQVYHWAGTNWTQDGTSGENLAGGAPGVAYVAKNAAEQNAILARVVAP
jgi:hypothetical protein